MQGACCYKVRAIEISLVSFSVYERYITNQKCVCMLVQSEYMSLQGWVVHYDCIMKASWGNKKYATDSQLSFIDVNAVMLLF